jgi:hypothetical protein
MPERCPPDSGTPQPPHWVLLRTAPDQLTAEVWCGLLEADDIPATLAPGDAVSFLGVSPVPCRVLVPQELAAVAELVLEGQLWTAEGAG